MQLAALQKSSYGMQHHMGFAQQSSNGPTDTEDTATAHTAAAVTAQRQQHAFCETPTIKTKLTAAAALKG
jgi:hypothetical protein